MSTTEDALTHGELSFCLEGEKCDARLVVNLSRTCVDNMDNPCCSPFDEDDDVINTFAGVWCIINAVVGTSGNLLTLVAIPLAKKNRRFGFHQSCDFSTFFILNLAFCDLLYCSLALPIYAVQYLSQQWPFREDFCYAFAAFRYIAAFAEWMSLAFIAISRCVGLLYKKWAQRYLTGTSCLIIITLIWAYAIGMFAPVFSGCVGTFGYNCRNGKCDYIQLEWDGTSHQVYYGIAFTVPCLIIFTSYAVIWWYMRTCKTFLRKPHGDLSEDCHCRQNELNLTWTLLMISLCYVICVGPIAIMNMVDPHATCLNAYLCFYFMYWLQYSLNFFIYALWNRQFRGAYADFFSGVTKWFRKSCLHCFERRHREDVDPPSPSSEFYSDKVVYRVCLEFSEDGELRRLRIVQPNRSNHE